MDDELLEQFDYANHARFEGWQDWLESSSIYVRIGRQERAENLGSADLNLTSEDLAVLDSASTSVQVQGDRDAEAMHG